MNKAISTMLLVILLISVAIAGCSTGSQVTTPTEKAIKLTIGTTNAVNDINIVDDSFSKFKARTVCEGLIIQNPDGSFAPCLAESWENPDASTWIFHLRKNATWHDGVPVTAKDIKFNLEYYPAKIAEYKQHWGQIDSVETPDNHTVVIKLKTPNSNFLTNLMVMRAVPEHIFKDVSDPKTFNDMNATIGSGPYKFVGFDKDAGILRFKAYDNYWGGKPSVDTIEIRIFKNQDTMIMALQKGEIDTTYMYSKGIDYYYVPKLLQDNDIGISIMNSTGVTALFFNTERPVLNNATFRRAISYAIDYNELNNLFTAGYGEPGTRGFLPTSSYNYEDKGLLAQDVSQSKKLLDSIGMIDRDGDGFREAPDGKKFQPELLTRTDVADYPRISDVVKKYLNAVGIDVRIKLVDKATFQKIANTEKTHDMLISSTTPWGMMTWCGYGSCYFDSRNIGYTMTKDPVYTSIVDRIFNTTDVAAQKQLAYEMQDYYASEMPAIAFYTSNVIQPYNKKYEGWTYDPMYGIMSYGTFFNLHEA
ncbi:ABC transporter substrate-binding protein [Methanocella conradii]|nr:ABC transporter substrate-binding protein [Methanocella conradii]